MTFFTIEGGWEGKKRQSKGQSRAWPGAWSVLRFNSGREGSDHEEQGDLEVIFLSLLKGTGVDENS